MLLSSKYQRECPFILVKAGFVVVEKLIARNGDYTLVIRWKKSRQHEEQTESPTLQKTRKRSSKARTDRNKRRLEAFKAKKSTPSTTENGESAQEICLENDPDVDRTNNTEENGEYTAQPTEEITTEHRNNHKLDTYKLIEKEKEPTFYNAIKRSHDHWLDVRDKRNFLYSKERKCHPIARTLSVNIRDISRIPVRLKILTGTYILQAKRALVNRVFNKTTPDAIMVPA
ncbi:unnamed protein product [Mytilus coruscus]|uniref:Uncharacterized protein n=1 Tax=Mytilus coruscus TaxID=42192 RepID=A0A6J8AJW4_MYTCO|nr:unnamed protein product [Mytilus coruscus]